MRISHNPTQRQNQEFLNGPLDISDLVVRLGTFWCRRGFVRNSRSRCGCGVAQVFECVDDLVRRIERRRLTLDDRDDRRRDRVQRERPEVEIEFSNPTSGHRKQN